MRQQMQLSVTGLAMGLGMSLAAYLVLLGWIAASGWGEDWVGWLSDIYIGYKPGFFGGIVGGLWGFVDGAIGGALIAHFYNMFSGMKISFGGRGRR